MNNLLINIQDEVHLQEKIQFGSILNHYLKWANSIPQNNTIPVASHFSSIFYLLFLNPMIYEGG